MNRNRWIVLVVVTIVVFGGLNWWRYLAFRPAPVVSSGSPLPPPPVANPSGPANMPEPIAGRGPKTQLEGASTSP